MYNYRRLNIVELYGGHHVNKKYKYQIIPTLNFEVIWYGDGTYRSGIATPVCDIYYLDAQNSIKGQKYTYRNTSFDPSPQSLDLCLTIAAGNIHINVPI